MLWIWHCTKRLWQYFWECYCQQCGFPEGKHIVWPNAVVTLQTQSRRLLLTSIIVWKTKEKQPVNTAIRYFTSNISESKCFTAFFRLVLLFWRSVWLGCVSLHAWINAIPSRETNTLQPNVLLMTYCIGAFSNWKMKQKPNLQNYKCMSNTQGKHSNVTCQIPKSFLCLNIKMNQRLTTNRIRC